MGGAAMLFPWTRTISVAAALAIIASCGGERELAGPGDDQASIVAAVAVSPESVAMMAGVTRPA